MEDNIINLPTAPISDEEFALFMRALFGPYKGPAWCPE
jgi:hypothetical protein